MKYDELDQPAKDKAKLEWEAHAADTGWWDHVYHDAAECARKLGIDIGMKTSRTIGGKAIDDPDISFSGFWCQGDGCSFSGWLRMAETFDAIAEIKAHAPTDEELLRLAGVAEALHGQFQAIIVADRLSDEEPLYPEYTTQTAFVIKGESHRGFSTKIEDPNSNGMPEDFEKACNEFVEAFASWIYDQLEREHEHLTSDESFNDWIKSNEPEFDEEGNLE